MRPLRRRLTELGREAILVDCLKWNEEVILSIFDKPAVEQGYEQDPYSDEG